MHDYPILEFDPDPDAIISAQRLITPIEGMPRHALLCFFGDQIARMAEEGIAEPISDIRGEMGRHIIYRIEHQGQPLAIVQPGVGAPLAAGFVEEMIAKGCDRFIACGGAGVLDREIAAGHLLIPTEALRDEGTSYHYMSPSRWVSPDPVAVQAIEATLAENGIEFLRCKTWTTDAFYRETPKKVAKRKAEGCLCVEMEASALFAAARFRDVPLAQVLYAGDDVSGLDWDPREWNDRHDVRERVIWLAAEACLRL